MGDNPGFVEALRYHDRGRVSLTYVAIAPLSEVAALCIDGIKNDNFWATYPSERQEGQLRARVESQVNQTPPDYLLNVTLMAPPPKKS